MIVSGTSVIAHLLADFGDLSKTIDIPPIWPPTAVDIMLGRLSFNHFIDKNQSYFSTEVIKEPWMTYIHDEVLHTFPKAVYITVARDPRNNIRSYLNHKRLPGDLFDLSEEQKKSAGYPYLFDPNIWGGSDSNYIAVLAHRWNRAVDSYLLNKDRILLVRYEDFCDDKYAFISRLAKQIGIIKKKDISEKLNIQYQPQGDHSITWDDFFGRKNLSIIESVCSKRMEQLNYPL